MGEDFVVGVYAPMLGHGDPAASADGLQLVAAPTHRVVLLSRVAAPLTPYRLG